MEGEDAAGGGVRIEAVGEEGADAGALVEEGERPNGDLEGGGGLSGVLAGLGLDRGEVDALLLGLDDADEVVAEEEEIVRWAGFGLELADGDPRRGGEVHVLAVLDVPTGGAEHRVDGAAGLLLRLFAGGGRGHGSRIAAEASRRKMPTVCMREDDLEES